jgi:hypothetical protein
MSISPNLFADRLSNIAITGPLVRIELATVQVPKAEDQQPQLIPSQTLIMPLDGFVASFGMMEAVMKQLVKDGVIKLQAPAATQPMPTPERPAVKKKQ